MGGEELRRPAQAPAVAASLEMEAATPPDDDDVLDVASTAATGGCESGGGGSGDSRVCGLTGRGLVDFVLGPA